jgi:MFS family permease
MALMSILLAPVVGKLTDRLHPRSITAVGFATSGVALFWLAKGLSPDVPYWHLLVPMAMIGAGSAGIWAPLSATATRNLPQHLAGAGAGVYNATRQIGAVLGAATIAVLIDARLSANGLKFDPAHAVAGATLPPQAYAAFSDAMGQALLITPAVLVLGLGATLFFTRPTHAQR